jgi:hypothetical protein
MSGGFTQWMQRSLERLKNQPYEIKSHVAFVVALSLTSIIALVWATTLPARFETLSSAIDDAGVAEVGKGAQQAQSVLDRTIERLPTTQKANETVHKERNTPSAQAGVGAPLNERIDALLKQIATTSDTRATETDTQRVVADTVPTSIIDAQQTIVSPPRGIAENTATNTDELYSVPPGTVPILIETRP